MITLHQIFSQLPEQHGITDCREVYMVTEAEIIMSQ